MEPNESGLTSYYHPHQQHPPHPQPQQPSSTLSPPLPPTTTTSSPAVTNGVSDGGANSLSYPQSVAGKAPEPQRRKRGRPRKYGTPEAAAAAKRASGPSSSIKRKEQQQQQHQLHNQHHHQFVVHGSSSHSSSASSKKSNFGSSGGQGFTPHVINVGAGEDVGQKIMLFMQQTKRELCILSASGSVSSASLRQPAVSGGSVAYEGRYDIISLTGSYVRSDHGGKAGGLSACLSSTNGQIVGGGVGGPLIAAGPVEVIVATFQMDPKKDASAGLKGDASASTTMPSPVSASTAVYRPVVESSVGFTMSQGGDDHHNMDGNPFMMQSQWRSGINYDLGGNTGHSSHDSPENGDYEQMPD